MKKFFTFLLLLSLVGAVSFIGLGYYSRSINRKARQFHISTKSQWKKCTLQKKREILSPELLDVLSQPFFFLGKGKQTIVFESADGKYVFKLFKHAKTMNKKLRQSFLGACLAQTKASEETGLVTFEDAGTQIPVDKMVILTKKGKIKKINITKTPFLLQKRAIPFKQELLRLKGQKDFDQAKERVRAIFALLLSMRQKNLVDRDGALIRNSNIGFIGNKAVLMDTGKLCILMDKEKITLHDSNRLRPLVSWCKAAFPELIPTVNECLYEYQHE